MPPEMRQEVAELAKICRADYRRYCKDLEPGGGRILSCLQTHSAELTDTCYEAMPRAEALRDRAVAAGFMPQ